MKNRSFCCIIMLIGVYMRTANKFVNIVESYGNLWRKNIFLYITY